MSGDLQVRKRKGKNRKKDELEVERSIPHTSSGSNGPTTSKIGPSDGSDSSTATNSPSRTNSVRQNSDGGSGGSGCLAKMLFVFLISTLLILAGLIYIHLHPQQGTSSILVNESPNIRVSASLKNASPVIAEEAIASKSSKKETISNSKDQGMQEQTLDIANIEEQIVPVDEAKSSKKPLVREVEVEIPASGDGRVSVQESLIVKETAHVLGEAQSSIDEDSDVRNKGIKAEDELSKNNRGSHQATDQEEPRATVQSMDPKLDVERRGPMSGKEDTPSEEEKTEVDNTGAGQLKEKEMELESKEDTNTATSTTTVPEAAAESGETRSYSGSPAAPLTISPHQSVNDAPDEASTTSSADSTSPTQQSTMDATDSPSETSSEASLSPKRKSQSSDTSSLTPAQVQVQRNSIERSERLMEAVLQLAPGHPIVAELRPHLDGAKRELKNNKLDGLQDTTKHVLLILEDLYVRLIDEKEQGDTHSTTTTPSSEADTPSSQADTPSSQADTPSSQADTPSSQADTLPSPPPADTPKTSPRSDSPAPPPSPASTSPLVVESAPRELPSSAGGGVTLDDLTEEDLATPQDTEDELNQLRQAEQLRLQDPLEALRQFTGLVRARPTSARAVLGRARCLDALAELEKSNGRLEQAIAGYNTVLQLAEDQPQLLSDRLVAAAGNALVDKLRFRGNLPACVLVQQRLLRLFPSDPALHNQLGITHLLQGNTASAQQVFTNLLDTWPGDGLAQAHLGFILKTVHEDNEAGARLLQAGLDSGAPGTRDPRFYFHLGDALHRLGRGEEAREVYRAGAGLGLFPSADQRSLYNVDHLTARPFWTKQQTTHQDFLHILEQNWRLIRKEGLALLSGGSRSSYLPEAETLRERGVWGQLELYSRGQENARNCAEAPMTCAIVGGYPPAAGCKRGQIKFSVMEGGTHVWPHCGPTNCRLRAHLGLVVPPGAELRVKDMKRVWEEGKVLVFDDSFEHEVWHNGTDRRLVLIVDLWHPDLTAAQRARLGPV